MEALDHRVILDEEPTSLDVVINHIKVIPEDCASSPPTQFVPVAYRRRETFVAAWAAWYGNQAAVAAAADRLKKVRIPELSAVTSLLRRARQPASILETLLGTTEYRRHVSKAMGVEFAKVDLSSRVDQNLVLLIGDSDRDRIKATAELSSVSELSAAITKHFPVLSSLFQAGGFRRSMAMPLLSLGELYKFASTAPYKPGLAERYRLEMLVIVLLRELPDDLVRLLLATCNNFAAVFPGKFDFFQKKYDALEVDSATPLHLQLRSTDFADLIHSVQSVASARTQGKPGYLRLLDGLEANTLSVQPEQGLLDIVYRQYVNEFAGEEWAKLYAAISELADSVEIQLDHKVFPKDLVGRPIEAPRAGFGEAIGLLRSIMAFSSGKLDSADFISRADKKFTKAREFKSLLTNLGTNLTASAMNKIVSLAQNAKSEIINNQEWIRQELASQAPLVNAWLRFYQDWDRLVRRAPGNGSAKQPDVSRQPAVLPHTDTILQSPVRYVAVLQSKLDTAVANVKHLEAECAELKRDNHSLRQYRESVEQLDLRSEAPTIDHALFRRIGARDGITPLDVLSFVKQAADGRVVVLDSAWKSARESALFPHSARLLDLMLTMVFDYYDELAAGKPDSLAKEILAGGYSAKESGAVAAAPKMRSMRVFKYLDKDHYFERHLRIGTGGGLECMRVHFDILDGIVVVAYVGPHLECASSK